MLPGASVFFFSFSLCSQPGQSDRQVLSEDSLFLDRSALFHHRGCLLSGFLSFFLMSFVSFFLSVIFCLSCLSFLPLASKNIILLISSVVWHALRQKFPSVIWLLSKVFSFYFFSGQSLPDFANEGQMGATRMNEASFYTFPHPTLIFDSLHKESNLNQCALHKIEQKLSFSKKFDIGISTLYSGNW